MKTQYKDKIVVIQGDNSSHEINLKHLTDIFLSGSVVQLFFDKPFEIRPTKVFTFENDCEARRVYEWLCKQWK